MTVDQVFAYAQSLSPIEQAELIDRLVQKLAQSARNHVPPVPTWTPQITPDNAWATFLALIHEIGKQGPAPVNSLDVLTEMRNARV